jgi:Ca2+-transporting ATPase
MTVQRLFVNNTCIPVKGIGYSDISTAHIKENNPSIEQLLKIGLLCNNSKLQQGKILGDPTEGALIVSGKKYGLSPEQEEKNYPFIDELPFDSERKLMTTLRKNGEQQILYTKGAPEELLSKCTNILIDGNIHPLTTTEKKLILEQNQAFAQQALRVL